MSRSRLLILTPFALMLASCMMGPNFEGATSPDLPSTWVNNMPPATGEASLETWWKQFQDPQLEQLIQIGFANNPDMIKAALAISSAEASLRSTNSGLFPSVGANIGGSNSGNFDQSISHGGWSGGLSASWSPDIWGETRRQIEAAAASLGSYKAAADATRTALASGIATAYFSWISAKESLRIAEEQLVYQEKTYRIVKEKVAAGMQSDLDLQESKTVILTTRATIPSLASSVRSHENTLAIYLGTTCDQIKLTMPSASTFNRVPRVPTGLPSELLRRRPDIVQAEYNLQSSSASIGVAVARLFPSISLTGSANAGSGTDFSKFFTGSTWGLSASASETIFNRVTLNENVNIAKLANESNAQSYRKTVLAAFAEVEEELITYGKLTRQLPEYIAAAEAYKKSAELSLRQYNVGNADFLNVASAERSWLSSELSVISLRQQIRQSLAKLCTAMGGGYEMNASR